MESAEIKRLIEEGLPGCQAEVDGDGNHFEAVVVGEVFANKSRVQQQQLVYKLLQPQLNSGEIHALSLTTKEA